MSIKMSLNDQPLVKTLQIMIHHSTYQLAVMTRIQQNLNVRMIVMNLEQSLTTCQMRQKLLLHGRR